MATATGPSRRTVLTRKEVAAAVKKAGNRPRPKAARTAKTWKKNGKAWSRVLGHFGAA